MDWLHLQWPAGKVEKLPKVGERGRTSIPGVYIAGDLSGVPLLKMSLQTGADCIRDMVGKDLPGQIGVVVIGGGVAGISAVAEAVKQGLDVVLLESNQLFSTISNFPKEKPIYTYPTEMLPESEVSVSADVKEDLLEELQKQVLSLGIEPTYGVATHLEKTSEGIRVHLKEGKPLLAKNVVIAIGRSGNYRMLGVDGEGLAKVTNRLHDPMTYAGKKTCVIGGGDSACEAAISIAEKNQALGEKEACVSLVYRGAELSRPKPENVEKVMGLAASGNIDLYLGTEPTRIDGDTISLKPKGGEEKTIANDGVLSLIGRQPPLDFFRKSGLPIHGEFSLGYKTFLGLFFIGITLMYLMKAYNVFQWASWNPVAWAKSYISHLPDDHAYGIWDTVVASMSNGFGFFIALLYCSAVVGFGVDRIIRRKTPYVKLQTLTLMAIQCLPLFILPEIVLPFMGHLGAYDSGIMKTMADELFPVVQYDANGREYWRAYGFILAWPLFVWNVFTSAPLWGWLAISLVQTFVLIPLLVWRWGKGAYCGWICSCGALAETMGDRHREKMPHGPFWNKVNVLGQVILMLALGMLALRVISWLTGSSLGGINDFLLMKTWKPVVDFLLAGALGVGFYFAYSGRVWCRFACPLAALMHIYARFSSFRIVVEQKKCISCNACTSVCHQGIDIMNFANKGNHMEDPECVRCSACVQSCPTGTLQFGRVDQKGQEVIGLDSLQASPVVMREKGLDS